MLKISTKDAALYNPTEKAGEAYWINTSGWTKVDTPSRMLGDEIICTYGRNIGTVAFVLFEDKRDAIMFKLSLK